MSNINEYYKKYFPDDVNEQLDSDLQTIIKNQEKELLKLKKHLIIDLKTTFKDIAKI